MPVVQSLYSHKLVKKIVQSTLRLQKFPYIGKKEYLLADRKNEYRFIVEKHYKIVSPVLDNFNILLSLNQCFIPYIITFYFKKQFIRMNVKVKK